MSPPTSTFVYQRKKRRVCFLKRRTTLAVVPALPLLSLCLFVLSPQTTTNVGAFVTPTLNITEEETAERGNGPLPAWAKTPERKQFFKRVHSIHVTDDDVTGLTMKWLEQGLSNFIASYANKKVKGRPKPALLETGECSKRALHLSAHAACIGKLLNGTFDGRKFVEKDQLLLSRFDRYRQQKRTEMMRELKGGGRTRSKGQTRNAGVVDGRRGWTKGAPKYRHILPAHLRKTTAKKWVGGFRLMDEPIAESGERRTADDYRRHRRVRRQSGVVKQNHYRLHMPDKGVSPLGSIAKLLMESVLKMKNKTEKAVKPWQTLVKRFEDISEQRKGNVKDVEGGGVPSISALKFKSFRKMNIIPDELLDMMDGDPQKVLAFARKKQSTTKPKNFVEKMMWMMRDAVKLGFGIAGHNVSDDETLKLASPRLFSLTPEEDAYGKQTGLASPSLFSLHNRGKGVEKLTSLPSLFSSFSSNDQQAWMDLIFETSNITEEADRLEDIMGVMKFDDLNDKDGRPNTEKIKQRMDKVARAKDGTPLYFTKENMTNLHFESYDERRSRIIEMLDMSYTKEQLRELNNTGYTMLRPDQLELFYGPDSPFHNPDALKRFRGMTMETMERNLEREIHLLAKTPDALKQIPLNTGSDSLTEIGKMRRNSGPTTTAVAPTAASPSPKSVRQRQRRAASRSGRRRKRLIFNHSQDLILSPLGPTTILNSPAVDAWTVLSPITFVAIINSPLVIGPTILSPLTFLPIILSPRVLVPVILSPIIFEPLVLSPLVIVPGILNPGMFNPLILSPYIITPSILSPGLFSPAILSPGGIGAAVLSPKVGSPLVLSPYFLFPVICSPSALGALVLSPYALSPVYNSPATAFSVILSPSWLS